MRARSGGSGDRPSQRDHPSRAARARKVLSPPPSVLRLVTIPISRSLRERRAGRSTAPVSTTAKSATCRGSTSSPGPPRLRWPAPCRRPSHSRRVDRRSRPRSWNGSTGAPIPPCGCSGSPRAAGGAGAERSLRRAARARRASSGTSTCSASGADAALQRSGRPRLGGTRRAADRSAAVHRVSSRGCSRSAPGVEQDDEAVVWRELDRVAGLLSDGRPYLCGERFTAADLTFAALSAPLVMPPGYGVPLPQPEILPEATARLVRRARTHLPERTRCGCMPSTGASPPWRPRSPTGATAVSDRDENQAGTPYLDAIRDYAARDAGAAARPRSQGRPGAPTQGLIEAIGEAALAHDIPALPGASTSARRRRRSSTPSGSRPTRGARERTWFLVNGASQGNLAAGLALAHYGERSCSSATATRARSTRSCCRACARPSWRRRSTRSWGSPTASRRRALDRALEQTPGAVGAWIVSPTYFGAVRRRARARRGRPRPRRAADRRRGLGRAPAPSTRRCPSTRSRPAPTW